jgi:hypothetical protein
VVLAIFSLCGGVGVFAGGFAFCVVFLAGTLWCVDGGWVVKRGELTVTFPAAKVRHGFQLYFLL